MLSVDVKKLHNVSSDIVKELILPEIEKEVNEGKNFANLRQIYNAQILAYWYKTALKTSLLGQVYVNKKKVKGIDIKDKEIKQKIYQQYLDAFKKGVYNYIKEDTDQVTQKAIPRKYFSGGYKTDLTKEYATHQPSLEFHKGTTERADIPTYVVGEQTAEFSKNSSVDPVAFAEKTFSLQTETDQFVKAFVQELEQGLKDREGNAPAQEGFVNITMRAKLEAGGWLDQEHLKPPEQRILAEAHSNLSTAIDTLSVKIAGLSNRVKDALSKLLAKDVNISCIQCDWSAAKNNPVVVAENIVTTIRNRHTEFGSQTAFDPTTDAKNQYLQKLVDETFQRRDLGNIGQEEGLDTAKGIQDSADAIIAALRVQETILRQSPADDDKIIADSLPLVIRRIGQIAQARIAEINRQMPVGDYGMLGEQGHLAQSILTELPESVKVQLPANALANVEAKVIRNSDHLQMMQLLVDIGEADLMAGWDTPGVNDEKKIVFLNQILKLNKNYPGGLTAYKKNAKEKLQIAQEGKNPFEGYTPSIPHGDDLTDITSPLFRELTLEGLKAINKAALSIPVGGLGTRLGYRGDIKLKIPLELVTEQTYIQKYIESILAIQKKSNQINRENRKIPLALMTSNETHKNTVDFLNAKNYFGMDGMSVIDVETEEIIIGPDGRAIIVNRKTQEYKEDLKQIVIFKQEDVAAMRGYEGKFVLKDPYTLLAQPHNHGDIHILMKQSGLLKAWKEEGRTHTIFFQDTIGQVFNVILPFLGNTIKRGSKMNFMTVSRKPGENVGAIAQMEYRETDGSMKTKTFNIEYNQLNAVLKATINPERSVTRDLAEIAGLDFNAIFPILIRTLNQQEKGYVYYDEEKRVYRVNERFTKLDRSLFSGYSKQQLQQVENILLKAKGGDLIDPQTGNSPFPGNTNVFILENGLYDEKLDETGGLFGELVNPKPEDVTGTTVISRLEAPMQDIAQYLPGDQVGTTTFPTRFAFSAVKNDVARAVAAARIGVYPESMAPGEANRYRANVEIAQAAGADIEVFPEDQREQHALGVPYEAWPMLVWSPSFASTIDEFGEKVHGFTMSARSVVNIDGEGIRLEKVEVDGMLVVKAGDGVSLTVRNLSGQNKVQNRGAERVNLTPEEMASPDVPEFLKIRGYKLVRHEAVTIVAEKPGVYEVGPKNIDGPGVYVVQADGQVVKTDEAFLTTVKPNASDKMEGGPTALAPELRENLQQKFATVNFDPTQVGGINLRINPALLDFQIKRDGNGIPLPINQQPIGDMKIEGFIPIYLYEKPVSLPLLLSSLEGQPANPSSPTQQSRTSRTNDPMDLSYSSPLPWPLEPKRRRN